MPPRPVTAPRMGSRSIAIAIGIQIVSLFVGPDAHADDQFPVAAPVIIHIDNFTFGPEIVTVRPGTAVTWINGDDIPHTVVAQNKLFRSKILDTDDRYTFTFAAPGEYLYFCSLHPHMTGTVVVKAAD